MRKIDKLIQQVIPIITTTEIAIDGIIDKQFKGYVSSYGAAITQSGLLAATIFFENKDADTEATREKIPEAILHLIGAQKRFNKLSDYILDNPKEKDKTVSTKSHSQKLRLISEAAVALKIAMRTFEFTKEKLAT